MVIDFNITKKTTTRQVVTILTKDQLSELIEALPEVPQPKNILDMRLCEYGEYLSDDYVNKHILNKKYAYKALGLLKSYRNNIKKFNNYVKAHTIQMDSVEKSVAKGIKFPSIVMTMIGDNIRYYNCDSPEKAEKMKVSSWVLMHNREFCDNSFNIGVTQARANNGN